MTEPNHDPATGGPTPDDQGALTPPPATSHEGQQYPPPTAFPPPPGTQYGNAQYGAPPGYYGQPNSGQFNGGQFNGGQFNGPYNPGGYNPGPYGYPQAYYPQPQGTSGMAIASLVLGICGFFCVTSFVGLGLGIAALTRISKTRQPGRGLAIAGVVLSSLWIMLLILTILTGHFTFSGGTNPGPSGVPNPASSGTPA